MFPLMLTILKNWDYHTSRGYSNPYLGLSVYGENSKGYSPVGEYPGPNKGNLSIMVGLYIPKKVAGSY